MNLPIYHTHLFNLELIGNRKNSGSMKGFRRKRELTSNQRLHRLKRYGAHAQKWLDDWTEWSTTGQCSDSCGKDIIEQTQKRSCNPTNICDLPYSPNISGGMRRGNRIWYCKRPGCNPADLDATKTRTVSFYRACPCQICTSKEIFLA